VCKAFDILLEIVEFLCAPDLYIPFAQPLPGMSVIFLRCRFCIHSFETRMAAITGYASFYAFPALKYDIPCNLKTDF
jgi:hypothetical protein